MAYIGRQPTAAALTASDITDGIVSTAKIADTAITNAKLNADIISGDTALGATPADTDELLVSDAGVLKRMDYSYIKAANTPAILVYRNLIENISDNTETKVSLDTEVIDTDGTFASNKWTPAVAGTYWIHGSISYGLASNGDQSDAFLYKNGSSPAKRR